MSEGFSLRRPHLEKANALQSGVLTAMGQRHDPDADAWFVSRMIAALTQRCSPEGAAGSNRTRARSSSSV